MLLADKKRDKSIILEDIYAADTTKDPKISLKEYLREYFKDSPRVERLLSLAILFFGLAAIGLGFFQFKSDIVRPFFPKAATDEKTAAGNVDNQDLLGLKQKDTDQDGLSDYDELNVYFTSPYLKDSDSDGFDDKKETERGSDPGCPEGQNCFAFWSDQLTNAAGRENSADLFSGQSLSQPERLRQLLLQSGASEQDLAQLSDEEIVKIFQAAAGQASQPAKTIAIPADQIDNLTPAQIRQMLIDQAGIAKSTLDKVSDQELMDLVKEILTNQGPGQVQGASNTAEASKQALTLEQVRQMTPAQIRTMLLGAGLDQEILDKTSDEDLIQLVNETITAY
ncbi:MAG: hypothetical protein A2663_04050 [Candidatus Buchananbacteria bacterium RIFCSPHIGHO2_01_FULL_46_12]|uniref:Uncharacterized protein n=3 Tax=Candidatus Buchananiibacteriota TaxID=1817903 RepID=A0A1G1YQ52_9BACT|nr:MAG: hypothetical protein A2663_04050 [Candidatus Buchananbacteria bacterium RIFCSPHIGHO2_01_FULL_46_12]OGY54451.1 MAG: hypothetical protein A3B15_00805 [Candidatus Buchananbacteria bacterium RIFCSPLOWO2_01_FULL_45_31]OGY57998.1 MAG: hypothetical protein A3H67_03750 [Candidatus Buchananbacteria bacterium RIFCSPLOWO2_02_FULL_46_11b]